MSSWPWDNHCRMCNCLLTGSPGAPGKPGAPSDPGAPCENEARERERESINILINTPQYCGRVTSASKKKKKEKYCQCPYFFPQLTASPGGPEGPLDPGSPTNPCQHNTVEW